MNGAAKRLGILTATPPKRTIAVHAEHGGQQPDLEPRPMDGRLNESDDGAEPWWLRPSSSSLTAYGAVRSPA